MAKDILARGAAKASFAGGFGETDFSRNIYKGDDSNEVIAPVETKQKLRKVFTPLGQVVLVRRAEAEALSTIVITENIEKDKPAEGTILAVGPDVTTLKVGDYVVFGKYAGAELPLNGETLLLMESREILGTLTAETTGEI